MSYDPYPPHDSSAPPDPYDPYDPHDSRTPDPYAPHPPHGPHAPHPYDPYDRRDPHAPHPYDRRAPHTPAPPRLTYPWQPPPPPPERRRPPRRPALGNHRDLRVLRGAYRRQRRVASLTALGYFCLFLTLSAFAPPLMSSTVVAGVPTGLLLALVQLPVTWLAIALYEHTAARRVDPLADRIRKQAELDARREAAR
ncbi:Uncharacterized membrane protein, DUF485 family [Streptomyces sp. 3213]|uniref:DUF485 domain-containing protein n=1 Tax=Streptomyces sp. 3213.3 TaxID=1855348 RepID=UPI00089CABD3|nr:DUF485 domain-containing protein [Streptomyces sp. 3213.3]SEE27651.1 Uncharacterized membrane protein, DUF485 family [Streptomyces sp. 3213] [Streptomyces sp. 3213.3]